jgi:hypothetical protein
MVLMVAVLLWWGIALLAVTGLLAGGGLFDGDGSGAGISSG